MYNSTRGNEKGHLWGSISGWRAGSHRYSTTINDVNENTHKNMVRVGAKQFDSIINIMNRLSCGWKVMHDMKGLGDDVMTLDTLMNKIGKKLYQTNNGIVKGSDLKGEYHVVIMTEQSLLDTIKIPKKLHTILAVRDVDEYISLLWYNHIHDDKLELNDDIHGSLFEDITRCHINLINREYNHDKGNEVARLYWIEQLLPDVYADIFTNAIQYKPDSIDEIEKVARQFNEVLNQ
jgi:hypothetical protein